MAGYKGYSMSNNAVEAYASGEKPYSKWRKGDILAALAESGVEVELLKKLKKVSVSVLKAHFLGYSSWHHTSSYYNKTDFYEIDEESVSCVDSSVVDRLLLRSEEEKAEKKQERKEDHMWRARFLQWGGTRRHPTATECIEIGMVKGDWFYRSDGTKKSIYANGFELLERVEEEWKWN